MRKTASLLAFITFTAFFLSGCSNLFDEVTAAEPPSSGDVSQTYISVGTGEDNARSALPSITHDNYTYLELTGRNRSENGSYQILGTWETYSQMISSKIPVNTGIWDFTLNAKSHNALLSCDIENYEIRIGSNNLRFELKVDSYSTTGNGNLSFTISYPSEPAATVKAQFLEPGTMAPAGEEEELAVTYGQENNTAKLVRNQMKSGTYILKLSFYSQGGLRLNTYSEIVVISENLDTIANRRLSSLNEIYGIKYVLNGGNFSSNTIPTAYTRKTSVVFPSGDEISRPPYVFAGWYDNPSYQNAPLKSIRKGTAGNIILYAKWVDEANQVVTPEQSVTADTQTRISCPDLIQMTMSDSSLKLSAGLLNYRGNKANDFEFSIKDSTIASIEAQSVNGIAFLSPLKKGFTELTVTHNESEATKEVLVFVGDNPDDLSQSMNGTVYFTTSDNVLSINTLNQKKTVRLTAKNLSDYECSNIQWTVSNPAVANVIGNGSSASVISLSYGKTEVTATHPDSSNQLRFYIFVTDPTVTINNPGGGEGNGGTGTPEPQNPLGIRDMTPYYLISSLSSGISTETEGWTANIQSPTEEKKYLWSYTHIVYEDNTYTNTTACIIGTYNRNGVNGTDGSAGADGSSGINGVNGVGITSMKAMYLISSSMSSVTISTPGWSETPVQPTEALRYLWSYTKVIYSDGTYTNTEPCIIGTWSGSGINGTTGTGAQGVTPVRYVTTSKSYYQIQTGNVITVPINTAGISPYDYDKISWVSSDPGTAEIIASNGISASIRGKKSGTSCLEASFPNCESKARITVEVVESTEKSVYISTSTEVIQLTKDGQSSLLQAVLVNSSSQEPKGFSFEIDNPSVAAITTQTESGSCYIKPVEAGQAQITVSNPEAAFSKKVIVTVGNSQEELADMLYLTTGANVVTVGEGNNKTINVSVRNSKDVILSGYTWTSSDPTVVSVTGNDTSAVINGNSIGTAVITCKQTSCKYPLNIIVQCIDPRAAQANPYIQLSASVINLTADGTYTNITAELVGGDSGDAAGFSWSTNDSLICNVYGQNETGKLKASGEGTTYITVSHPKANYPAQILVICDKQRETECYISVPASIITMKPSDAAKSVTASLINGNQTDKYNFSWSLDVYDVIDFQYSANICTITPKQAGTVTITISHPKAAFDQQIIVNIQQYSDFAFPGDYINITEGSVQFLNMEVPTTNQSTYIRYYLKNPGDEKIVSITGTKSVAQITGVGSGSCTVYADLIATSTGTVQSTDDLLVYVKPKPADNVYITSSTTINTIQRGKSQTLSAYLTGSGITQSDQYDLKWSTSDTDVISIGGLGADGTVKGNSIYVTAKNITSAESREAIITCTHEKASSALQFYIFVPGAQQKYISVNKAVINLTKGSSGTSLSATIDNAESREDYTSLKWSVQTTEGDGEIVRVIGSGQTVQIYPVGVGECVVKASLDGAKNDGLCTVFVEAPNSFAFEDAGSTLTVLPGEFASDGSNKKTRKFTVSPADANLTFTAVQSDEFFKYSYTRDKDANGKYKGTGTVEIEGIKLGSGTLSCVTDGNAKSQIRISVNYDNSFDIQIADNLTIEPVPANTVGKSFSYQVRPAKDFMEVRTSVLSGSADDDLVQIIPKSKGEGVININPHKEYLQPVRLKIYAYDTMKKQEVGARTVTLRFQYSSITPVVNLVSKDGRFTRFENGDIVLGDGESATINISVLQQGANYSMENAVFVPNPNASQSYGGISGSANKSAGTFTVTSNKDTQVLGYRINRAYCPVYNGTPCRDLSRIAWAFSEGSEHQWLFDINWHYQALALVHIDYSSDLASGTSPYKYSFAAFSNAWFYNTNNEWALNDTFTYYKYIKAAGAWWNDQFSGQERHESFNLISGSGWSITENPSETGKFYSKSEFENIAWYWCPGDFYSYQNSKYLSNGTKLVSAGIMTEHVDATYTATPDTTEVAYFHIGTIQYNLMHNGQYQQINGSNTHSVNVWLSVRNCAK